eukprot:TRINITY_DN22770_c0_g1_i1.p1 TRINITY_DN22770_c0_g1~~TRINITY_DN22770_c0_g1_i1.p1  ORF type:complete len:324 (+),score=68.56 TRINITY_DN22770_c0_g1_i1:48-974(+)
MPKVKRPKLEIPVRDIGINFPLIGFGTYKLKKEEAYEATLRALESGYRLIDTAQIYDNEKEVGRAIKESGIKREQITIVTKVWRSSHGYDRTSKSIKQSLRKLGVDYIDLVLIHWPGAKTGWPLKKGTICPPDWTPSLRDTGTWKALEDFVNEDKIKSIGVANYTKRHLQSLLKVCSIPPSVNQVELHPLLQQTELKEFCDEHNIALQAFASLGSGDNPKGREALFSLPPVVAASKKHSRSPAQILLRWATQQGVHVIPKSSDPQRVVENLNIFDFKMTNNELKQFKTLDEEKGTRFTWKGLDPETVE